MGIKQTSRRTLLKGGAAAAAVVTFASYAWPADAAPEAGGIGTIKAVDSAGATVLLDGRTLRMVPLQGFPDGYVPRRGERVVVTPHTESEAPLVITPLVQFEQTTKVVRDTAVWHGQKLRHRGSGTRGPAAELRRLGACLADFPPQMGWRNELLHSVR